MTCTLCGQEIEYGSTYVWIEYSSTYVWIDYGPVHGFCAMIKRKREGE